MMLKISKSKLFLDQKLKYYYRNAIDLMDKSNKITYQPYKSHIIWNVVQCIIRIV
jgi:hypothetical protein